MRIIIRFITILILFAGGLGVTYAQEKHTEISIDFRVNSTEIDHTYSDNAASIRTLQDYLEELKHNNYIKVLEIQLCGAASPEGSDQLNRKLARGRIQAIEKMIREDMDFPESIIIRNDSHIPWDFLKEKVAASSIGHKDEVLSILNEESELVDYHHPDTHIDSRIIKIAKIDGGKVWKTLHEMFFEPMRNACVIFVTTQFEPVPQIEAKIADARADAETLPLLAPRSEMEAAEPLEWTRSVHIKTNLAGWGLGAANAAAEVDLTKHLSIALSAYYSGWDYFKPTLKFRTLSIQPELRYYPSLKEMQNEGFFVGAHFGLGYYNYALNKEFRIQDHKGKRPSIGGGISIGYAIQFKKNPRWGMEFAVGGGVYDSVYDIFYNEINGPYAETSVHRTWFGVDNASIAFTYKFDMKKNGGRK